MKISSMANKNYRGGFTLLELLVVIAILGLLAAVILTSLGQSRLTVRDKYRLATLYQIQSALETYYVNHGRYPPGPGFSGWDSNNPPGQPRRWQNPSFDNPLNWWYCDDAGNCIYPGTDPEPAVAVSRRSGVPGPCCFRYDAMYELIRRGYLSDQIFDDPVNKEGNIGTTCATGAGNIYEPANQSYLGSGPPCDLAFVYCSGNQASSCGNGTSRYNSNQRYVLGTNLESRGAAWNIHGNYQIYEGGQRDIYIDRNSPI